MLLKDNSRVVSPCRRNCCLDNNDTCVGCFRSLEEILAWHYMSDSQKNDLLQTLKFRAGGSFNIK
ncbi:DUF1289 domain-containing protein [Shewanella intestini]|uniref:DUF1289 domain-containing protein n=1 Tax=Shewanella intestini TaxID=2017544 RepID=A0ABS5I645_9GAMM|nr:MULTISPECIES: DUF1289 domain-containing protein [Shewanella]MBR9729502.1 DUF1289 domain-containing protein [Shewanella intestini]MRG37569.1 DUF1289 domain-containing protein [Shewanella sp. XMDDZSB0408]